MEPGASKSRPRRILALGREYLTHWAIAGAILALTGFAPEHWFADLFVHLAVPETFRHEWLQAVDIRIGFVGIGVAIIAWDVLRRSSGQTHKAPFDGQGDRRQLQANNAAQLALPDKPSIAVLPFENMSGDSEQEYFADGMVEDIITALSRFRQLFVIARNSSFIYKGRAIDVKEVGRDLGVRYILEGSVRKVANRVRITGQLIDAVTGAHLWADQFDGGLEDVFDLQDRVTTSVIGAIAPKLEQAEIERARRKPTENLDAYDNYLRGIASVSEWNKDGISEGLRLFYRAIELDSNFASAYGMAAWCYVRRKSDGWMTDIPKEVVETRRLVRHAAQFGKDDAVALSRAGFALAFVVGDVDDAAELVDRALVLNPNLAAAWYFSGRVRVLQNQTELAIEHEARAMRLSPLDPLIFLMQYGTALAHFVADRYNEASTWGEKAIRQNQNFLPAVRIAAASNALAGRPAEAQKLVARLRNADPSLCISSLKDRIDPFQRARDSAKYVDGLRKAGLPE